MNEIHQHNKNWYKQALDGLVAQGDVSAVIFANKTQNKDMGFGEKLEVNHTGTVNHQHSIDLESLELPLEVRRVLLKAIQEQKAKQGAIEAQVVERQLPEKT